MKLLLLTILAIPITLFGQKTIQEFACASELMKEQIIEQNSSIKELETDREKKYTSSFSNQSFLRNNSSLVLPIVFHELSVDSDFLPEIQITNMLQELNDAFTNDGSFNSQNGVSTGIQFCLAKRDINNADISGIVQYNSSLADMSNHHSHSSLTNLAYFPSDDYINIIIVDNLCVSQDCESYAGYAVNAYLSDDNRNAIVIEASNFDNSFSSSTVLIHEMGHYLGLLHTFHGGCDNNNCLTDGDRVCDTPPDDSNLILSCQSVINSCLSDSDDSSVQNPFRLTNLGGLGDQNDLSDNFMDYNLKICRKAFTQGQADRMCFFVENYWTGLLASKACYPPCQQITTSEFDIDKDCYQPGEEIIVNNLSGNGDNYQWSINQQIVSNEFEPTLNITNQGEFEILLKAWSNDITCDTSYFTLPIKIDCSIEPTIDFTISDEWLVFQTPQNNTLQYEWQVLDINSNIIYSSSQSIDSVSIVNHDYVELILSSSNLFCEESITEYINILQDGSEICGNGIDDDLDGLIDSFDADCSCNGNNFNAICPIECQYIPTSFDEVNLKLKWVSEEKIKSSSNILTGDLDGDGNIEVVGVHFESGFNVDHANSYVAIHSGLHGNLISKSTNPYLKFPSIADLDNDGKSEIIVSDVLNERIDILSNDLIRIFSTDPYPFVINNTLNNSNSNSIADINNDGIPELIINNSIYNLQTGKLLLYSQTLSGCNKVSLGINSTCFTNVICADLLPSQGLELAAGNIVYEIVLQNLNGTTGNAFIPHFADPQVTDGYTSIGDIDNDGEIDVICVRDRNYDDGGGIWIWNPRTSNIIASAPSGASGGIAFVGDVDNDCFPEIGVTFENELRLYKYDGDATLELLYSIQTIDNSGYTGVTMFDFNQDGKNELVYRDETHLMIIEGATGKNIGAYALNSITGSEYPIVADIDNDGEAEILVSGYLTDPDDSHIYCFEAETGKWAPARSVWNQYSYHVTNINDDLTVPRIQQSGAVPLQGNENCVQNECSTPYNNFLVQATYRTQEGCVQWQANDFGILADLECLQDSFLVNLQLELNSRYDTLTLADQGVAIKFYSQNALGGYDCIESEDIYNPEYNTTLPIDSKIESIVIVINSGVNSAYPALDWNHSLVECDYSNNFIELDFPTNNLLLDLGADISSCDGQVIDLAISSEFEFIQWSDYSSESTYSSSIPGLHFVQAQDGCGNIYRDTVELILDTAPQIQLDSLTTVCAQDSFVFSIDNEFTNIQWSPANFVSCATCSEIKIIPTSDFMLTVIAERDDCLSFDSTFIQVKNEVEIFRNEEICEGEEIEIEGQLLVDEGQHKISINDCDSTLVVELIHLKKDSIWLEKQLCDGDSILIDGDWYNENGNHSFLYQNQSACDSLVFVEIILVNEVLSQDTMYACQGDTIDLYNQMIFSDTTLQNQFQTISGCDSTEILKLIFEPLPTKTRSETICYGDSIHIGTEWFFDTGVYSLQVSNQQQCDTIIELDLIELPEIISKDTITICYGDSIEIFDALVYESGDYSKIFTDIGNCDSTAIVTLEILQKNEMELEYSFCEGDSLFLDNILILNDTIIEQLELSYLGCDSTIKHQYFLTNKPEAPVLEINCDESVYLVSIDLENEWEVTWSNGDLENESIYFENDISVNIVSVDGCEYLYELNPSPIPDISTIPILNDTTIQVGETLNLNLNLDSSTWSIQSSPENIFNCDTCLVSEISPIENSTIELFLTNSVGCEYFLEFNVAVSDSVNIFIPNIFTPNQIENNLWQVHTENYNLISNASIYDRWGNLIKNWKSGEEIIWDGQFNGEDAAQGVYIFSLNYYNNNGELKNRTGTVTLLR